MAMPLTTAQQIRLVLVQQMGKDASQEEIQHWVDFILGGLPSDAVTALMGKTLVQS